MLKLIVIAASEVEHMNKSPQSARPEAIYEEPFFCLWPSHIAMVSMYRQSSVKTLYNTKKNVICNVCNND